MQGEEIHMQTIEVIEGLHRTAMKQIGCLIEEKRYGEARQVADILAKVGIV